MDRLKDASVMFPRGYLRRFLIDAPGFTHNRAVLKATALLLAAERHRRKHGEWPGSSGSIDAEVLAEPPVDPFTGRPFQMERRDGRFFIRSSGPSQKDDRGEFDPRRWQMGGADDVEVQAWDAPLRRRPSARLENLSMLREGG
jgi:hypothetical protein